MPVGTSALLSSLSNGVTQGAASQAFGSLANQSMGNYMSLANPTINSGILSSLSSLGSKAWDLIGSQQGTNVLNTGAGIFNAFNQYNQGKDYSKMLKAQEARSADAYARDKEAAAKRQLLTF